ncbi:uncharacterized protein LOC111878419 [Lactuca sativa]|uniref:uncharacterized protein LOC111878419 n=1 Tax=Lactuca sativa TaxID=4236 RepID=UPI000CD8CACE|nr:uncharacterized protein LOC111878419 [Lactuca sativa]
MKKDMVFRLCLGALIAHTGNGEIAPWHGNASIRAIIMERLRWVAGSNNDVNVLDQSLIFDDLLSGKAPDAPFTVNENEYNFGYYLKNRIYPQYSTFVKVFRHPIDPRDKYFKRRQEGARKDVERAFGVLKSKWHIVEHAARPYELDTLRYIMYACIIRVVDIQDQRKHKQLREDLADYIYVGHEDEDE